MNRILVISDIHGMHDEFNLLLNKTKYNPDNDQLILLGDYVDRGRKSKQVVSQVREMVEKNNVIAIRGNHDQMFVDWLTTNDQGNEFIYFYNGGLQTVESYYGNEWYSDIPTIQEIKKAKQFILSNFSDHIEFLSGLPYYYETDEFIFVHAGINPFYENWRDTPNKDMIWIRDLFINNQTNVDKTVIFGHTPCINLHETEDIWYGEDKIGIDGGCAYGFQLNCLEINSDGYKGYYVLSGGDNLDF